MGYVLTNCNTCGWPNGARCPLDTDEGLAEHDGLDEWIENNSAAENQAPAVAYATSTGCPGWKPKPAAQNIDRAQIAAFATDSATIRPDSATRRNCWTCRLDSIEESTGSHLCHGLAGPGVVQWVDTHVEGNGEPASMPAHNAPPCPGWERRPAGIPSHDIPGHRPDADTEGVGILEHIVTVLGLDFSTLPVLDAAIPRHRPDDLTHVRAQLAEVGTVKDSSMVAHTSGEWMQVRRAAWDATLATIARLESRIDRLESRADEAERLARGVGPRVASLFRRDRLRGRR